MTQPVRIVHASPDGPAKTARRSLQVRGAPVVATAAAGDSSEAVATTAFVTGAVSEAGEAYQPHATALDAVAAAGQAAFGVSLLGLADAAAGRGALGLGSLAVKSAVGNADWAGAGLVVANGGTGAATATDARSNLGVYGVAETNSAISAAITAAGPSYAAAAAAVPAGGASGAVLKKASAASYDAAWTTLGTASSVNTGVSGAVVPLLSTANTWTNAQTAPGWAISTAAGVSRPLTWRTGAASRWTLSADGPAESGANAGSWLRLAAYSDTGASLGDVFTVARADRITNFAAAPTWPTPAAGTLSTAGATTAWVASYAAAQRGAAGGVAPLDASGKVPTANLPALAITDTFVAASQAEMLALGAQRGDIAVRSDLSRTFALAADDPAVLANWVELRTPPNAVSSVAGRTGAVVLTASDVAGLGSAATQNTGVSGGVVPLLNGANTWSAPQAFSQSPTAPTPAASDSSSKAATTAFVATGYQPAFAAQAAHLVYAGPAGGSAGAPSFRALAAADLPDLSASYQPKDATLAALALANTGADQVTYWTGADTAAQTPLTAAGRALIDDATAAAQRMTLNVDGLTVIGDSNYTMVPTDRILAPGTPLTANRTWTLPAANSVNPGQSVTVLFAVSPVSYAITVAPSGTDLLNALNAGIVLSVPHCVFTFYSNGSNAWVTYTPQTLISATVSTTDASANTLLVLPMSTSNTVLMRGRVVARRTGGTAGSAEDAGGWEVVAVYKYVGGLATAVGTPIVTSVAQDQAGWTVTLVPSTTSIRVRVAGAANNNIDWRAEVFFTVVN